MTNKTIFQFTSALSISESDFVAISQGPLTRKTTIADILALLPAPAGGTVTSVGLVAPAGFSVAGSPITLSGNLQLSLDSQAAGVALIGPTSGGAATPTFRTLVPSDYPTMVGDAGAGGEKGAVPPPAAGDAAASKFLKADGTWAVPAGMGAQTAIQFKDDGSNLGTSGTATSVDFTGAGVTASRVGDAVTVNIPSTGVSDGDKGDVVVSGGGAVWTVDRPAIQGTGLTANEVGFRVIPQNSQSAAYTTVAADSGKHILHPSSDASARTFTIDSNANVAYPIGTAITFINQNGAGVVTIAITADTMRLAGAGTTGSRTLAANGVATAVKIATTEWIISGTGLT